MTAFPPPEFLLNQSVKGLSPHTTAEILEAVLEVAVPHIKDNYDQKTRPRDPRQVAIEWRNHVATSSKKRRDEMLKEIKEGIYKISMKRIDQLMGLRRPILTEEDRNHRDEIFRQLKERDKDISKDKEFSKKVELLRTGSQMEDQDIREALYRSVEAWVLDASDESVANNSGDDYGRDGGSMVKPKYESIYLIFTMGTADRSKAESFSVKIYDPNFEYRRSFELDMINTANAKVADKFKLTQNNGKLTPVFVLLSVRKVGVLPAVVGGGSSSKEYHQQVVYSGKLFYSKKADDSQVGSTSSTNGWNASFGWKGDRLERVAVNSPSAESNDSPSKVSDEDRKFIQSAISEQVYIDIPRLHTKEFRQPSQTPADTFSGGDGLDDLLSTSYNSVISKEASNKKLLSAGSKEDDSVGDTATATVADKRLRTPGKEDDAAWKTVIAPESAGTYGDDPSSSDSDGDDDSQDSLPPLVARDDDDDADDDDDDDQEEEFDVVIDGKRADFDRIIRTIDSLPSSESISVKSVQTRVPLPATNPTATESAKKRNQFLAFHRMMTTDSDAVTTSLRAADVLVPFSDVWSTLEDPVQECAWMHAVFKKILESPGPSAQPAPQEEKRNASSVAASSPRVVADLAKAGNRYVPWYQTPLGMSRDDLLVTQMVIFQHGEKLLSRLERDNTVSIQSMGDYDVMCLIVTLHMLDTMLNGSRVLNSKAVKDVIPTTARPDETTRRSYGPDDSTGILDLTAASAKDKADKGDKGSSERKNENRLYRPQTRWYRLNSVDEKGDISSDTHVIKGIPDYITYADSGKLWQDAKDKAKSLAQKGKKLAGNVSASAKKAGSKIKNAVIGKSGKGSVGSTRNDPVKSAAGDEESVESKIKKIVPGSSVIVIHPGMPTGSIFSSLDDAASKAMQRGRDVRDAVIGIKDPWSGQGKRPSDTRIQDLNQKLAKAISKGINVQDFDKWVNAPGTGFAPQDVVDLKNYLRHIMSRAKSLDVQSLKAMSVKQLYEQVRSSREFDAQKISLSR